jgi:tellurite resistance protein
LSRAVNQIPQSPWARLVWLGIAVLALVQVVAFYRVCSGQVQRAHARDTAALQQRNALTDCLDYEHNSTISSCARQARADDGADSPAARDMLRYQASKAALNGAVPVSYVFN